MTAERKDTGHRGEELAAAHLRKTGYGILARNYRCPFGELDIVAERSGTIVFVEVRARRLPCMVRPEETVGPVKARRVVRAAEHYLSATHGEDQPWRVDVVAVEMDASGTVVRLEQYEDALADVMRQM